MKGTLHDFKHGSWFYVKKGWGLLRNKNIMTNNILCQHWNDFLLELQIGNAQQTIQNKLLVFCQE